MTEDIFKRFRKGTPELRKIAFSDSRVPDVGWDYSFEGCIPDSIKDDLLDKMENEYFLSPTPRSVLYQRRDSHDHRFLIGVARIFASCDMGAQYIQARRLMQLVCGYPMWFSEDYDVRELHDSVYLIIDYCFDHPTIQPMTAGEFATYTDFIKSYLADGGIIITGTHKLLTGDEQRCSLIDDILYTNFQVVEILA